jgi:hypothetical protein
MVGRSDAGRRELRARRLSSQRLRGARFGSVADAASGMLATQAQDFHGAKWALALRSTAREVDVDAALACGSVVRSWPMRGTLMLMAAADVHWLTTLLARRSFAASAGVWRAAGLGPDDFARAADLVGEALSGGRFQARAALLSVLDAAGLATGAGRGSHLLRQLAGTALIVFGPPNGTEQTFALLDEWVPSARRLGREEALAELARRYVAGHGPATVRDLAWWSGLTLADVRLAVALAGDAVAEVSIGGTPYLVAGDATPTSPSCVDTVHLLPGFDELLLGYGDRSASLAPDDVPRVLPARNGLFLPTIVVDGRVVGVWRRTLGAGRVEVSTEPFGRLGARRQARLERSAAQYAAYLRRDLLLT